MFLQQPNTEDESKHPFDITNHQYRWLDRVSFDSTLYMGNKNDYFIIFLSFIILSILLTLSVEGKSLLILTLFSLSSLLSSNINGCPDKRQQSVLPCPAEDYRMISGFILLILISSSLGFHMTRHVTPSSLNPSVHNVFLPRLETPHPIISVMVRLTWSPICSSTSSVKTASGCSGFLMSSLHAGTATGRFF